jgi:hypothetical protein
MKPRTDRSEQFNKFNEENNNEYELINVDMRIKMQLANI